MPISPIENRIGCIFIPVSDMARAIDWYSRLLGLPIDKTTHGGLIYNMPIAGDLGLILDGHKLVTNSSQPSVLFLDSRYSTGLHLLAEKLHSARACYRRHRLSDNAHVQRP